MHIFIIATIFALSIFSSALDIDAGVGNIPPASKDTGTNDLPGTNVAFDLPDLTAIVETTSGLFQLEAYKSTGNDQIIQDAATGQSAALTKTSQLFWVSVGQPEFVKTPNPRNKDAIEIFHNSTSGFNTYIQMLTPAHRTVLAGAAQTKYHVEVNESQIVNLILQRFECVLGMYDENGDRFLLKGKVSDFRQFPLRMDFLAPPRSKERKLFVETDSSDLNFMCKMTSAGKLMSTRTLFITGQQQQIIGIEGKLFGESSRDRPSSVYVTKGQMKMLSSEMYVALNIAEEYQILEGTFGEVFEDGLISQIGMSDFAQVPIAMAFESLSKYGVEVDLDMVNKNIRSLLVIDRRNKIILNETVYAHLIESISGETDADLFGISTSVYWAQENSERGLGNPSLIEQLRDLNSASPNGLQWIIQNDKVVPKSLNVARLSRAKLGKTLTFNKIRSQTFIAPFDREVAIYTNRVQASTPFLDQLQSRINSIQSREGILATELHLITSELRADFSTLSNQTTLLRTDLDTLAGLPAQVASVNADIGRLTTALGSTNQKQTAIESQSNDLNDTLKSSILSLSMRITALNAGAVNTRKDVETLSSALTALSSQVNSLSSDLDKSKASVESVRSAVNVVTTVQINGLSTGVDGLRTSLENLKSTVSVVSNQLYGLNVDVSNLKNTVSNLGATISAVSSQSVKACRICFKETEGSSQCQGYRYSCSSWSNQGTVDWTLGFRDDTDGRDGGCNYHWLVECVTH